MRPIDGIKFIELDDTVMGVTTGDSTEIYQGIIKLNKTGYEIWKYAEQGLKLEEIATRLCGDFEDLDYDSAFRSAKSFTDKLIEKGILIKD